MAMKLLVARERATDFYFKVLLDDTKTADDTAFLAEYTWGKQPPDGQTKAQYLAAIRKEVKALCTQKLAELSPGTVLAGEGAAL